MILHGDCLAVMATMEPNSVDAIVTDPPYELGFMGKKWDGTGIAYDPATWEACLRVLKPGGHLLAFGGTRTSHRMICAIEDAGFEIRDSLVWLYGQGFPKSLDVSKAIDKAAGAERDVIGFDKSKWRDATNYQGAKYSEMRASDYESKATITAPATPEAEQWQGWGTALKPGHEPICLARKPLTGTVAANVLAYGTGAINIDACRIRASDLESLQKNWDRTQSQSAYEGSASMGGGLGMIDLSDRKPSGRWPANVLLDSESAELLDAMSGTQKSGVAVGRNASKGTIYGNGNGLVSQDKGSESLGYGDTGGASRFFYTAKASRSERNAGLDGMNGHPTIKPISLMRWLVRLVTPPGGTILDPFTGSGSTGCAAALEGFDFIGIEQDAEYCEIARNRIAYWATKQEQPSPQLSLFEEVGE